MNASRRHWRGRLARICAACIWPCLCLFAAGCFRVDVYAPLGKEVYLLSEEDEVEVSKDYRTWYVIYGWYTLDERMPDVIIDDEYLSEVRVAYKGTLEDAFISFVSSLIVVTGVLPQTMVVEGNRKPDWKEHLR